MNPSQPRPEHLTRKQITDMMLRVIYRYVRQCERDGEAPYHTTMVQLIYDKLKERGVIR